MPERNGSVMPLHPRPGQPGYTVCAGGSLITSPPVPPKDIPYRQWVIERIHEVIFQPLRRSGWQVDGLVGVPPWNAGMPGLSVQIFDPGKIMMVTSTATASPSGKHSKVISGRNLIPDAALVLLVEALANPREQRDHRSMMRHGGGDAGWRRLHWEKYTQEKIALKEGEDPVPLILGFLAQFRSSLRLPEGLQRIVDNPVELLAPPTPEGLWLVQDNLSPEPLAPLYDAIREERGHYFGFTAKPFSADLPPLPPEPFFPMGTVNTVERIRAVRPECVLGGDSFRYSRVLEHHAAHLLNERVWIGPLAELIVEPEHFPFFLRPNNDDKSFTGQVWWKPETATENFWRWRQMVLSGDSEIPADVIVVKADPTPVTEEWRLVVTAAGIVAHACYRCHGVPWRDERPLPEPVRAFATARAAEWLPAPLCVMDVTAANAWRGPKIVEFGSLHSCGLYTCDRRAIVRAVHAWLQSRSSPPACPS